MRNTATESRLTGGWSAHWKRRISEQSLGSTLHLPGKLHAWVDALRMGTALDRRENARRSECSMGKESAAHGRAQVGEAMAQRLREMRPARTRRGC